MKKSQILNQTLPIHKISDEEIKEFICTDTSNNIKLMWIGHATSLVNIENCIVLVDPIFRYFKF